MDITVNVTSALTNSQRRISPGWTVEHLKQRLEPITGVPPQSQLLLLYPLVISSEHVELSEGVLSQYSIPQGARIQVHDVRPESELTELEDDSNVQAYEMDDEEYDKRTNTLRNWKRENKLGAYDPNYTQKKQASKQLNEASAQEITLGSRFRTMNLKGERRGEIRFVGKIHEIDGNTWVGVEFDEPLGKNDGSIDGVYYFKAKPGYGGFLKPQQVHQGDYPELDLFGDDDDDDDDEI